MRQGAVDGCEAGCRSRFSLDRLALTHSGIIIARLQPFSPEYTVGRGGLRFVLPAHGERGAMEWLQYGALLVGIVLTAFQATRDP